MPLGADLRHRSLQLLEVFGRRMLRVHLRAQRRNLMLRIMRKPPDRLDILLDARYLDAGFSAER